MLLNVIKRKFLFKMFHENKRDLKNKRNIKVNKLESTSIEFKKGLGYGL